MDTYLVPSPAGTRLAAMVSPPCRRLNAPSPPTTCRWEVDWKLLPDGEIGHVGAGESFQELLDVPERFEELPVIRVVL